MDGSDDIMMIVLKVLANYPCRLEHILYEVARLKKVEKEDDLEELCEVVKAALELAQSHLCVKMDPSGRYELVKSFNIKPPNAIEEDDSEDEEPSKPIALDQPCGGVPQLYNFLAEFETANPIHNPGTPPLADEHTFNYAFTNPYNVNIFTTELYDDTMLGDCSFHVSHNTNAAGSRAGTSSGCGGNTLDLLTEAASKLSRYSEDQGGFGFE